MVRPWQPTQQPLNFSHPLRNSGVAALVTSDPVNPANLAPAPPMLQILPPPMVEHPNDDDNDDDDMGKL